MTSADPNDVQDLANELLAAAIELASTGEAVTTLLSSAADLVANPGDAPIRTTAQDLQQALAALSAAREELIASANMLVSNGRSTPHA
jgi:hypothetical protein